MQELEGSQTYIFIRFVCANNYKSENNNLAFLLLGKISESSKKQLSILWWQRQENSFLRNKNIQQGGREWIIIPFNVNLWARVVKLLVSNKKTYYAN